MAPFFNMLFHFLISPFFLNQTILVLIPYSLNFLFFHIIGGNVIVIIRFAFKSILVLKDDRITSWEKMFKWVWFNRSFIFFEDWLCLSSNFCQSYTWRHCTHWSVIFCFCLEELPKTFSLEFSNSLFCRNYVFMNGSFLLIKHFLFFLQDKLFI